MMKYYRWPDGRFIGGFDGVKPPEGAIEVTVLPDDGTQIWDGNKWVWTRVQQLEISHSNLNRDFTQAMQRLQTGWPLYEILTWDKQSTEANAWLAAPEDAKPVTPFLSSLLEKCLALGAQDTLENLVGRVHANDLQYTEAVTAIMAVRHVAEDQINAADEPMSVTWQFPA